MQIPACRSPARQGGRGDMTMPVVTACVSLISPRCLAGWCLLPSEPKRLPLAGDCWGSWLNNPLQISRFNIECAIIIFSTCLIQGTRQINWLVALCGFASLFAIRRIAVHGSGRISDIPSCFIQLFCHTANASTYRLCTLLSNLWASERLSSSVPVFNFPQPFSAIEINLDWKMQRKNE